MLAGHLASAADREILEQQRLLWMLGYGNPIDGKPGSDTNKAVAKFLDKERGGVSLEGSALTEVLKQVVDKYFEERRAEGKKPVIKTALPIDTSNFIYLSEQRNLLLAGSCGKAHVFRLDNLRPIDHLVGGNCRATVGYSDKDNILFETYTDGVVKRDVETGFATDYYSYANDFGFSEHGVLLPDESGLVIARNYTGSGNSSVVTLLDLAGSRRFSTLFSHRLD